MNSEDYFFFVTGMFGLFVLFIGAVMVVSGAWLQKKLDRRNYGR